MTKPLNSDQVYDLSMHSYRTQNLSESQFALQVSTSASYLDSDSISKLHAESGELFKSQSGFGFIAKGSGSRVNEVFVATRGTASVGDVATDLNAVGVPGIGGHIMHQGFYKTFRTYAQDLDRFIKKAHPNGRPHAVHCMGHSLGGALANLNAAALAELDYNVYLYTVASPRVGQLGFAEHLSSKMKHDQIYRVANMADPVTMVPFYPYMHGPLAIGQINIDNGGFSFNPMQHMLKNGYTALKHSDWANLKSQSVAAQSMLQVQARQFNLADYYKGLAGLNVGGLNSFKLLWILAAKLDHMLNKKWADLMCTRFFSTGAFTAIDQWAEMLFNNMALRGQPEADAKGVLAMISRFLGRAQNFGENLTYGFIRHVLELFMQTLMGLYKLAVSKLSFA